MLFVNACAFEKDSGEKLKPSDEVVENLKNQQVQESVDGKLTEENVRVWFEELPTAGLYELNISWPKDIARAELAINDDERILTGIHSYKQIVEDDREFKIRLKSHGSLISNLSIYTAKVKSPKDYLVRTLRTLKEDEAIKANRVFFLSGARIETLGHSLSIETNFLIVEDTLDTTEGAAVFKKTNIITNLPNRVATEKRELLGSNIYIKAKKAVGHLAIAMIGVDGRNGRSGEQIAAEKGLDLNYIDPALNGKNGANAESFEAKEICMPGASDIPCFSADIQCSRPATAGTPGLKGNKGEDAEDGWQGGSSGNLFVIVEDPSAFSLSVLKKAGLPGQGALGSPGYPGGKAGKSGVNSHPCKAPESARDGDRGDKGKDGDNGAPGKDGVIEISPMKFEIREI